MHNVYEAPRLANGVRVLCVVPTQGEVFEFHALDDATTKGMMTRDI